MSNSPSFRLRKHADYQWVYAHGRKQFGRGMGYFFAVRPPLDSPDARRAETAGPRIGLTVPKALGKAHDRNRIKRRLREAVRHRIALLSAPVDLVLHPRRSALQTEFEALEREVAAIFRSVQAAAERVAAGEALVPNGTPRPKPGGLRSPAKSGPPVKNMQRPAGPPVPGDGVGEVR